MSQKPRFNPEQESIKEESPEAGQTIDQNLGETMPDTLRPEDEQNPELESGEVSDLPKNQLAKKIIKIDATRKELEATLETTTNPAKIANLENQIDELILEHQRLYDQYEDLEKLAEVNTGGNQPLNPLEPGVASEKIAALIGQDDPKQTEKAEQAVGEALTQFFPEQPTEEKKKDIEDKVGVNTTEKLDSLSTDIESLSQQEISDWREILVKEGHANPEKLSPTKVRDALYDIWKKYKTKDQKVFNLEKNAGKFPKNEPYANHRGDFLIGEAADRFTKLREFFNEWFVDEEGQDISNTEKDEVISVLFDIKELKKQGVAPESSGTSLLKSESNIEAVVPDAESLKNRIKELDEKIESAIKKLGPDSLHVKKFLEEKAGLEKKSGKEENDEKKLVDSDQQKIEESMRKLRQEAQGGDDEQVKAMRGHIENVLGKKEAKDSISSEKVGSKLHGMIKKATVILNDLRGKETGKINGKELRKH